MAFVDLYKSLGLGFNFQSFMLGLGSDVDICHARNFWRLICLAETTAH